VFILGSSDDIQGNKFDLKIKSKWLFSSASDNFDENQWWYVYNRQNKILHSVFFKLIGVSTTDFV